MPAHMQTISNELSGLVSRLAPSLVAVGSGRYRASGFVWRPGLIVTADESLADDAEITVTLPGATTAKPVLVGRDAGTDIALLRIDSNHLPPVAPLTGPPPVGALMCTVGADGGAPLAALGVVAASSGPWRSMRGGEIDARIDLDLRLAPGMEGSVAADAAGQVFGMVVSGPRRRVLVIPSATIERVAARLLAHGRIPRGYLGLGLHPVSLSGAQGRGAMVMNVDPQGPGAAAGVHQGDILVAWDGKPIDRLRTLMRELGPDSVGRTIVLEVRRGAATHKVSLQVAERPAA